MDYILKLNLFTQQELHHLFITVSDGIFTLIRFICPAFLQPVSSEAARVCPLNGKLRAVRIWR